MRQGWKTLTVITAILSCLLFFAATVLAEDSPEGVSPALAAQRARCGQID